MKKKRVCAIVGAGAALEIAGGTKVFPSTNQITKEVVKLQPRVISAYKNDAFVKTKLIKQVYKHMNDYYQSKERKWGEPNFEELIYVLERLYTYAWTCSGNNLANKSIFDRQTPIVEVLGRFKKKAKYAKYCTQSIVSRIMEIVLDYDQKFADNDENEWYRAFWREVEFSWDVFTFNYDTTIEQSVEKYNDGFVRHKHDHFKLMDIRQLLRTGNVHTISHPHGCIQYGFVPYNYANEVVYKYQHHNYVKFDNVLDSVKAYQSFSGSGNNSQNGSSFVPSPIVSGLDKLEKTDYLPMSAYRHFLYEKAVKNSSFLIVGYSFGDMYVNNILERLYALHGNKLRVCLIDYWRLDEYIITDYDGERDKGGGYSKYTLESFMGMNLSHELVIFLEFITRTPTIGGFVSKLKSLVIGNPLMTEDGRLMICYNGFKDAVINHEEEIKRFLYS